MKPSWRQTFAVFACFLLLYLLTCGGHLYSPDEEIMFRVTESLARRGELSIPPILDPAGNSFASARGSDGREYAQYGVANSLFAVPFYYAGLLATKLVPDETATRLLDFKTMLYVEQTGAGRGHQLLLRFAVSFFGLFVGAATCALVSRMAWRLCADQERRNRISWLAALAYGAGTMAWPHGRTFFSEPLATLFFLAAFSAVWGPEGLTRRKVALCGTWMALSLMARLDTVFVFPALVLFLTLRYIETRAGSLKDALGGSAREQLRFLVEGEFYRMTALFAAPLAVFAAWYLGMNYLHFGGAMKSAYADQSEGIHFTTPLLAGLYGFLFSAGKSLFLFSPIVAVGIFAFPAMIRRCPAQGVGAAAAALLILLIHARWQNWPGGWCWGPRHIFMIHAFLILPLAVWLASAGRGRMTLYGGAMAASIIVQLYGCSQNFIDFYILYYRTTNSLPQAYAMYSSEDGQLAGYRVERMNSRKQWEPADTSRLPAPINDTIYVPQNSQWYRYWEMMQFGYIDNLWLRLWARAINEEVAIVDE
ncbi:MAG: hypothetical protein K1X53_02280 [Candidatus Sumerlaeaceae bacterium]|nr:hypothetical protein [Candidatus Sumerlaeaceae bacterium]